MIALTIQEEKVISLLIEVALQLVLVFLKGEKEKKENWSLSQSSMI
jgi:hypothetical protein